MKYRFRRPIGGFPKLLGVLAQVFALFLAAVPTVDAALPTTTGWYALPNSTLRTLCPNDGYGGTSYQFYSYCPGVTGAWNSAVMDTKRNRLVVWGGGHNNYAGNEFYAVNLNDQTIQRLNSPSVPTNSGGACSVTALPDGAANGRHTYDGIAYMANVDKMFVFGGGVTCAAGGTTRDTWAFDFATLKWEAKNPSGPIPRGVPGIVTAYDSNTGKVFLHDDWYLYSYDYATNAYQQLAYDSIDYHLTAVIDPKRQKFLMIGNGQAWVYSIAPGSTYTRQALVTSGGAALVNSIYPGLAYDPVSDRIVGWNGGDTVYSLNLDTGVWTPTTYSGGPGSADATGTFKRWNYSPASGVFVIVNSMLSNTYVLRTGTTTATVDTTPDAFSFPAQTSVAPGAVVTSAPATVSGVNAATPISIAGGSYSVNGGAYTTASSTVQNGNSVTVRVTASASAGAQTCATLTIGGVSGQFCVTTASGVSDTTPDAFSFPPQSGVALNASVTSSQIAVTGINAAAPISVSGGTYSINGGAFVSANSTVNNNDAVSVRLVSAGTNGAQTCATLTIGGVSGQFCATTQMGTTNSISTTNSFALTSPTNQTMAPFTVGLGFKKGDVPGTPVLSIPDQQVIVMRRWNDGSVKHAIASGHVSLSANSPKTISVSGGGAATGTTLTAASIQSANPQASVAFGSYGTVSLASLLGTPFRTFASGPEMVEAHYRAAAAGDATLVAWFHVRLYKSGKVWVRVVGDNGFLDVSSQSKSYVPVVTIGGTQVWNNGGAALTHYAHTRWTQDGWIGTDPQITPQLDTGYLKSTKLVPNYLATFADQTTLSSLYQSYAPNQSGNWTPTMGDTGYQEQIGLLPKWDALYVTSGGDARAYRSVVANAKALNSYAIQWNDSVTKVPVRPSDRPTWSQDGAGAGGGTAVGAGGLGWDIAHHGSGGYLAYLITGDYFYLDTMAGQAAISYLLAGPTDWTTNPAGTNFGTSRYFNGQTRGYAWAMRTLSQYAAIAPAGDPVAADYAALLSNNIAHLKSMKDSVSPAGIGYIYEYDANHYGVGMVAPWQQHFFIQSLGMGSDLEPLGDMTAYNSVRDYMYRAAVGILGDSTGYCFIQASGYTLKSNSGTNNQPNNWYKTWAEVYAATFPTPPACTNTLAGTSGGDPLVGNIGYWGNLMPAIAYAVDHGATGSAAAWARLTGATNWGALLQSGFDKMPSWGVIPRGGSSPSAPSSDTSPDAFGFVSQTGVALSTTVTSNTITVTGINAAAPISIAGGTYSINGGAYTSAASTVTNGTTVTVRLTSSASNGTQTCAVMTIGGVGAQFCATTVAGTVDTTPDLFAFTAQIGVSLGTSVTSNAITVSGINAAAPISIVGGTYSINGGAYTATASNVSNGSTVTVRLTSAASNGTLTCATLTIGGVNAQFCATTLAGTVDTTPDAFGFSAQTNVGLNVQLTSNTITPAGFTAGTSISIVGGSYSVSGGAFTTTPGTINPGQTVAVRLTSSSSFGTSTTATLTIGGVSGGFTVTTVAQDTTPTAFSFTSQTGVALNTPVGSNAITVTGINAAAPISVSGGAYSVNGSSYITSAATVTNGSTVSVGLISSTSNGTQTCATLNIGGVTAPFCVTTLAGAVDTTPDAFGFSAQTNVGLNVQLTSNTITPAGYNAGTSIAIAGGSYSVNGGAFTTAPGTINPGQTVAVRLTSSSAYGTSTTATLTIGGVNGSFTATTVAQDTTPAPFSFASQSGVALSTTVTSNAITVTGINAASPISIVGGAYAVNGGAYSSGASTVTNGSTVTVRLTSASSSGLQTCATLNIGGVTAQFCATTATAGVDTTPDAFGFTTQAGVPLSVVVTSNAITVSGINAPSPVSVTNGSYSINGSAYTSNASTVSNGNTVTMRLNSSSAYGAQSCAALTIGGVVGQFCVTTVTANSDTTPDPFSFAAKTGVALNTNVTSNAITVTGINAPAPISVSSGTYSVNGGTYMSGASTVTNGSTVTVRTNSASTYNTQACATLKIGGTAAQFCVTTMAESTYATVSVQSKGRGSGSISSGSASGTCESVCTASVASGTAISLRATPSPGSVFTGWLGACTGSGSCNVTVRSNVSITATFAASSADGLLLDVDENGTVDGATDGAIIQRYLGDITGTALTQSFIGPNAQVTTSAAIIDYLNDIEPLLDIDGNGIVDSSTDGELLSRYLRGLRKGALVTGAIGQGAIRTSWKEIEGQIAILLEAVKP